MQEIAIVLSGLSKIDTGNSYETHEHPYYQLNHIVRGSYRFTVGDEEFAAGVGDTILIPASVPHSLTDTGDETGYYFEVKFSSFSQGVKELCDDIGVCVRGDEFPGLVMKEIFDENNNATPASEGIMVNYLYSILFKMSSRKRWERHAPSKYIEVSAYSEPVRDTIRFLEDHYTEHLSLDDIVAHTTLGKSYLSALFKKETTVTIFECLMIIRIRKAVELLTYTDMALSKVSAETGFVNITHFIRMFTKHVMIPPGQFKKHLRAQSFYWSQAMSQPLTAATLGGRKIDFPRLAMGS